MGRVSLTESYDDRSVISKLNEMDKRVKENTTVVTSAEASAKASAAAAQETADRFAGSVGAVVQNANAQINASKAQVDQAKAEVDATVTTVAQAVQTANDASASAQQSATTVEGYDTRLTAVEDADTQNVKLDGAQTITGQKTFSKDIILKHGSTPIYIVRNDDASTSFPTKAVDFGYTFRDKDNTETGTIFQHISTDKNSYLCVRTKSWATGSRKDCDITLVNNADGSRYVTVSPTLAANAPSNAFATKGYVESTDGETNNLVHRTTNEIIDGTKTFDNNAIGIMDISMNFVATTSVEDVGWRRIAEIDYVGSSNICMEVEVIGSGNNRYAKVFLNAYITTSACVSYIYGFGNNAASVNTRMVNDIALVRKVEGTTSHVYLMVRNERYENWLAKLTYFGGIQGRYDNVATRARKVVGTVEPEPTTDTYVWVSKPTKMTVI